MVYPCAKHSEVGDTCCSLDASRGQVTPPPHRGNKKKIPGKNLQEYPNPGATSFVSKRGNALINNKHFNAPRRERYLKFKQGIQVWNSWRGGMINLRLKNVNSSRRALFFSDLKKWICRRPFSALKLKNNTTISNKTLVQHVNTWPGNIPVIGGVSLIQPRYWHS